MDLFSQSLTTLEHALDLRMTNQRLIAANLANIDTPGYTARRMDFEASMNNAIQEVNNPDVIGLSPEPSKTPDGNNVDLETELGSMTQNKVMYSVTAQVMSAKLRQLSSVLDQEP